MTAAQLGGRTQQQDRTFRAKSSSRGLSGAGYYVIDSSANRVEALAISIYPQGGSMVPNNRRYLLNIQLLLFRFSVYFPEILKYILYANVSM